MELLLCYTSKKVTSQLHELNNYKRNYTSTMYMKVITSLCKGITSQRKDKDDTMILSRGSRACQHASPRCVDRSLVGSAANWHHTKPTRWAPQEPTLKVRVAQWHAQLELLFVIPVGWARSPSQILLQSTTQSSHVLQRSHKPRSRLGGVNLQE